MNLPTENPLEPLLVGEERMGITQVYPFDISEIGGWTVFTQALSSQTGFTYEYLGEKKSRFSNKIHFRYQQLYNSVPVADGSISLLMMTGDEISGYQIPPHNPTDKCDGVVSSFRANIYENITITTVPSVSQQYIETSLPNESDIVESSELMIINNLLGACEYKLVWKVYYSNEENEAMISWFDAHSGELLVNRSRARNLLAWTADHGFQNMPDREEGDRVFLRNDRLTVYDYTSISGAPNNFWEQFEPDNIPRIPNDGLNWSESFIVHSLSLTPFYNTRGHPQTYQLFWMADQVIERFDNLLDIEFVDVRASYSEDLPTSVHSYGTPETQVGLGFGDFYDPVPEIFDGEMVEYDIIAHELGHAIVAEFFSSDQIEGHSLHEAISDMFAVYIESQFQSNIDWIFADEAVHPSLTRDIENTGLNCFTLVEGLESHHDRGEALGHWFYLCVAGKPSANIPSMDIKQVLDLVIESLPMLGGNPDYSDLMEVTMDLVEEEYGTCSDQFKTILGAWEEICVPTHHRLANPDEPCMELVNFSGTYVCEENNYFKLCVSTNSGVNLINAGTWWIIGKNSVNYQSTHGLHGNIQNGGGCLEVATIPNMPYYPQYVFIEYWNSEVGELLTARIVIRDCDMDDVTCDEYFNTQGFSSNGQTQATWPNQNFVNADLAKQTDGNLTLVAYDLMGNDLNISQDDVDRGTVFVDGVIILTYWDNQNLLVETQKRIFFH